MQIGLRESVNQALLREGYHDPNLRERVLKAPIIGKQKAASQFGDVVILARGQLFALNAGNLIFIQDPYSNDCDECHNIQRLECGAYNCKVCNSFHIQRGINLKRINYEFTRIIDILIVPIGLETSTCKKAYCFMVSKTITSSKL